MKTIHTIINGDSRQMSLLQNKFLYLCFENETFINVHLLKAGLTEVYEKVEFLSISENFRNIN
jgi:hypothetical protein